MWKDEGREVVIADEMEWMCVEAQRTKSRGGRIYLKLCVTVTKQKDILKTRVTPDRMTLDMIEITTII
ncbi:hypothetical protein X798_03494 [Onchocerca flexuosa]|uniref:Uncharacterized protein n=1 Tax=Onchocerca flexuosa TaxID=387005 RepID=A0A238BXA0_9BILA|nr:hypothetical protein X798_03494 [Onchocerca flexuosa]